MNAALLRFPVHEAQRHEGMLLWEWLLRRAGDLGARSGCALRPIAGFGGDHILHEQKFVELAGSLTVEVELLMTAEQVQRLLQLLQNERVRLPYTLTAVTVGVVNPDAEDPGISA